MVLDASAHLLPSTTTIQVALSILPVKWLKLSFSKVLLSICLGGHSICDVPP